MDMTCRNCGKEVYQTGVNFRDAVDGKLHYDGINKEYLCQPKSSGIAISAQIV